MDRTIAVTVDEKVVNPLTQRKIKTDGVLAGHLRSRGILPSEQTCYKPVGCLERRAGRNKLVVNCVGHDQAIDNTASTSGAGSNRSKTRYVVIKNFNDL